MMSNLSATALKKNDPVSSAHDVLSTMIARSHDHVPVIGAVAVAEMVGADLKRIITNGVQIAAKTSRKFKDGPQSWYNWHVVFSAEINCFIAVRRTHPALQR